MTIAIVCDILSNAANGTNLATNNLINYLRSKGHTVRVICCDTTKNGKNNYYVVPMKNYGHIVNKLINKTGAIAPDPRKGKDVLKDAITGCDLVHTMLPFKLCKAALLEAKKQNIPCTTGCHLLPENVTSYLYLNHAPAILPLIYHHWDRVYKLAIYRHYPTQMIRDRYEKNNGKSQGSVISNGIPSDMKPLKVSKPKELKDKIVINCVGRYGRDKDQKTLLKAIKYSKYKDSIQLILAGSGILEHSYRKLGKKLPIYPIFKSYNRKELRKVINYSDFCVHPAYVEAEGISVLENIACGKLVIVSDSATAAPKFYMVDHRSIFKACKPKELAKTIDWWIEHPKERKNVEKKNLKLAKQLSINVCLGQMEKMFLKVIKNNKTRQG